MNLRHAWLVAAVTVTGLAVASPAPARPVDRTGTSQVIGQTAGATSSPCGANQVGVQHTTSSTPAYETPAGVITSFSYLADANVGQVRALVFTKTASHTFHLVGKSELRAVQADTLNTFPARIPVPAGAVLGSQVTSAAMRCRIPAITSGDEIEFGTYDPDTSSTFTTVGSFAQRWNISAVVESDADGDGYGDVTQDLCPESAATHAACGGNAPDTTVTKAPTKRSTKRKATIKFTSTAAGSTFTCAVDKKPARPCTSPFKKKYKYGKHQVVITATSPAGTADPSPVTVKFRVTRPKR